MRGRKASGEVERDLEEIMGGGRCQASCVLRIYTPTRPRSCANKSIAVGITKQRLIIYGPQRLIYIYKMSVCTAVLISHSVHHFMAAFMHPCQCTSHGHLFFFNPPAPLLLHLHRRHHHHHTRFCFIPLGLAVKGQGVGWRNAFPALINVQDERRARQVMVDVGYVREGQKSVEGTRGGSLSSVPLTPL